MNDLRIPIGSFFALIGIILLVTSFASGSQAPLAPGSVDLYSGLSMLVFGIVMLWLARRALR